MPKPATESAQRIGRWMRDLALVREGTIFSDGKSLWWFVGPFELPPEPLGLAHELLGPGGLRGGAIGAGLGARSSILIDDAQLARWWRSLARLRAYADTAERYRLAGLPMLRAFRDVPVAEFAAAAEDRLRRFRAVFDAATLGDWPDPAFGIDGREVERMTAAVVHRRVAALFDHALAEAEEWLDHPADLAIRLLHPESAVRIPRHPHLDPAEVVGFAVAAGSRRRCEELWDGYLHPLFQSGPTRESGQVLTMATGGKIRWLDHVRSRRWRCDGLAASPVEAHRLLPLARHGLLDLGEAWASDPDRVVAMSVLAPLIDQHDLGGDIGDVVKHPNWAEGMVAVVLATLLGATGRDDSALLDALHRLTVAWPKAAAAIGPALRRWAEPPLSGELAAGARLLAEALGVEPAVAVDHLAHRMLLDEIPAFSSAIHRVLTMTNTEDAERQWLHARRSSGTDLSPAQQARLENLEHGDAAARLAAARAGAANTLRRSTVELRRRSLHRLLDAVLLELARARLALEVDRDLPPAARAAVLLMLRTAPGSPDDTTIRRVVAALVAGQDPARTRRGLAWEQRAASAFDVAMWKAGFAAEAEVRGEPVTVAIEQDPHEVLKMGSYFDTCLSLSGGSNALSVIANLSDVNKAVVYVRATDGTVIGRKLIGITATGELAGYRTYAHRAPDEILAVCREAVGTFATAIGARLSDAATPESLGGFWYDDGNERWTGPIGSSEDEDDEQEPLEDLRRRGDEPAIRRLARGYSTDAALAALLLARAGVVDAADASIRIAVAGLLLQVGELDLALRVDPAPIRAGQVVPCPIPAAAREFVERVWPHRSTPGTSLWMRYASVVLSVRSADLLDGLADLGSQPIQIEWQESVVDLFVAAVLRGDGARLRRFLADDESRAVAAAACVPVPEARDRLRGVAGTPGHPLAELAAQGLGRLAHPEDAELLLRRLARDPASLSFAYAAHRCGAGDTVRRTWRPHIDTLADSYQASWRIAAARRIAGGDLPSLSAALRAAARATGDDDSHPRATLAVLATQLGLRDTSPADVGASVEGWEMSAWRASVEAVTALDDEWTSVRVQRLGDVFDPDVAVDAARVCAEGGRDSALAAAEYLANVAPQAHAHALVGLHALMRRWPPCGDRDIDAVIVRLGLSAVEIGSPSALHVMWCLADRGVDGVAGEVAARLFRFGLDLDADIAFDGRPAAVDVLARSTEADREAFARALCRLPNRRADDARLRAARQLVGGLWDLGDVDLFDARLRAAGVATRA